MLRFILATSSFILCTKKNHSLLFIYRIIKEYLNICKESYSFKKEVLSENLICPHDKTCGDWLLFDGVWGI